MELHWLPEAEERLGRLLTPLLGRIAACSAAERVRAPREKLPRGVELWDLWEVTKLPVLEAGRIHVHTASAFTAHRHRIP